MHDAPATTRGVPIALKLGVVLAAFALIGAELVALRQQRLIAVSEIARSRMRTRDLETQAASLRTELARELRPESLLERIDDLGPMKPITEDDLPARREETPGNLQQVSLGSGME